jgi:hypothetical protein
MFQSVSYGGFAARSYLMPDTAPRYGYVFGVPPKSKALGNKTLYLSAHKCFPFRVMAGVIPNLSADCLDDCTVRDDPSPVLPASGHSETIILDDDDDDDDNDVSFLCIAPITQAHVFLASHCGSTSCFDTAQRSTFLCLLSLYAPLKFADCSLAS